jgi:diguanylate cyclase (GGDEF)-like protein
VRAFLSVAARHLDETGLGFVGGEWSADPAWRALHPGARFYIASVIGLGAAALAISAPLIHDRDVPLFATLTLLSLIASFAKVSLPVPRSVSTLTACYVVDFTTLLLLGRPAATLVASAGAWSQCTFKCRRQRAAYQRWFSIGALALTVQITGLVYAWLGGEGDLPRLPSHVIALIAAAAVFFLSNTWLVAGAVGLSTGQSIPRVWKSHYLWIWPGHLLGLTLAAVAAAGIGRSNLWLLPFAAASLAVTHDTFKTCVARFADSVTDPLTDLPNLRYLITHGGQELARATREGVSLAFVLIDLDGFKSINDTYGHRAGDRALRQVAECLLQSVRTYDICARYGGDEFVIVLPGCGIEDAQSKAAGIQNAIATLECEPVAGVTAQLRASVGIALFPDDGDTFEALLGAADRRMFQDKGERPTRRPEAEARAAAIRSASAADSMTTEALLREQLLQAQKLAAVGELASGVAHDFNNALTAILGYSDMLAVQIGPDKPVGRDLNEIINAARHAASLTHQLLTFSSPKPPLLRPVDLNEIVCTTQTMLRRLLAEPITIATKLSPDLDLVTADATQLQQVLVNLAVNARDAMPAGGALTIETHNVELDARETATHPGATAGAYISVSVSDTGAGMTPDVQARIFEPFFTTKGAGRGTGLGLATVRQIVAQLGGYVAVRSELGRGSTFRICLPRRSRRARPSQTQSSGVTQGMPVGAETILLVEDAEGVREFATSALRRHGYKVLTASSAEAALTMLERVPTPIHLLLTDVVLPGIDGWELAVRVERDRPDTRILFTTGYVDQLRQREPALEPGGLLAKPYTARALLTKARELLDSSAPRGGSAPAPAG